LRTPGEKGGSRAKEKEREKKKASGGPPERGEKENSASAASRERGDRGKGRRNFASEREKNLDALRCLLAVSASAEGGEGHELGGFFNIVEKRKTKNP